MKFKPRTDIREGIPDFTFYCPGCKCDHGVWTTTKNPTTQAIWQFNGNVNEPTVTPSLLVTYDANKSRVCHSFVTNGFIQYLGDCTHELKGQTIEIPQYDESA